MKAILLMFDSLRRDMLPPYGGNEVIAPNFQRLAQKTVVFNNAYMGSMPCMPARRELHTGRYNFLHRIWGPLEPFDDSMPEILKKNGIYTHLTTDHAHYWEDGGSTYHSRYNSWEFFRGQQGDHWKGEVNPPEIPEHLGHRDGMPIWLQDWINRKYMLTENDLSTSKLFKSAEEFIRTNKEVDDWFLQIESFSPHEPFYVPQKYLDMYQDTYKGPHFNWPDYAPLSESPAAVEHCRKQYMALVTMCDHYLGTILDLMDEQNMWKDTMLIVNADHGFLLGEHGRWGKRVCSNYNEIANIPLFIWDPRCKKQNEHRKALVQTIDIAPTLLDFFGIAPTPDMQGVPLKDTVAADKVVREAALFGLFGHEINCTDGRYVYMRAPECNYGENLYNYTLMPMHMVGRFTADEITGCEIAKPFAFTKGCITLKTKPKKLLEKSFLGYERFENRVYDLASDPKQQQPINNSVIEERMAELMIDLMKKSDAPPEQYIRIGLK